MGRIHKINRGFCVYWIPTNSSSKEVLALIEKEYNSINDSFKFTSKAINTDNNGRVKINLCIEALSDNSVAYSFNVRFKSVKYNKDGLLSLSYSVPSDFAEEFDLLKDLIYRHVKCHFHRHVYHDSESGEMLHAYYDKIMVDPTVDNNKALEFYLDQINRILNVHNEYLIDSWHLIQESWKFNANKDASIGVRVKSCSSHKKVTADTDADREKRIKRAYSESCQQVIDQISFFNTLIYSEQNKDGHLQCAGATVSRMRQLTREINNNIIAMRTLNERAKAIFYDKTIESNELMQTQLAESAKSSSRLGWISLALGLLSLGITIWQSCMSNSDKEQTEEALLLLQKYVSLPNDSVIVDSINLKLREIIPNKNPTADM